MNNSMSGMSDPEKWAWWTLSVALATIVAYIAFVAFWGHGPAATAVFALLALIALPAFSRRRMAGALLDERETGIAGQALRAGLSAVWLALVTVVLVAGWARGWRATLAIPVWTLGEALWWAVVLLEGVRSAATIVLYRGWYHA